MEQTLPKMIKLPELMQLLDIGRTHALELCRRKDFPSIKMGREYRVFKDKLPEWLHKQQKNK
jgi:excisionase family DNA binding protein